MSIITSYPIDHVVKEKEKQRSRVEMFGIGDLQLKRPIHPGNFMTDILLPQLHINFDMVVKKSGISENILREFSKGNVPLTKEMRRKLRGPFGEVATLLDKMQVTYDYFEIHGRRPPQRLRP